MKNQAEKSQPSNLTNPFLVLNPFDGCHYDLTDLLRFIGQECSPEDSRESLSNVMDAVLIDFKDSGDIKSSYEFMGDMHVLKQLKKCFKTMTKINTNKN